MPGRLVGASDSSLPHWVAAEIAAAELPQHQPPGSGLIINVGAFHDTMGRPRAAFARLGSLFSGMGLSGRQR